MPRLLEASPFLSRNDLAYDPDGKILYVNGEPISGPLSAVGTSAPFGNAGLRVIKGEEEGPFYGFCGIANFASGKWVLIYRKGTKHGIEDNAELRAVDSYDKGKTWTNDRLLYQNALSDARPDAPKIMANNRCGFFVNRQDEGATHFSPLFFKSDDEGVTFTYATITTSSGYTFQAAGGIIAFPASKGGHDTLGFISYGYLSATGLDAFTTVNNGDTWSTVLEVAQPDGVNILAISENYGVRIGTQDKWLHFCRSTRVSDGGWNDNLMVYATSNPLNWGTPIDAGIGQLGNPPAALYDPETNKIHYFLIPRTGTRQIPGYPADAILMATADADALYNAGGDFASLGINYEVLARVPSWPTGYMAPFLDDGKFYATFTAGESGVSETLAVASMIVLIGDFVASGAEASVYNRLMTRRMYEVRNLDIESDSNEVADYSLTINNKSRSAYASFGAYGAYFSAGYKFDGLPITLDAEDNVTTTYPLIISNNSETASASFGAYGCSFPNGYVLAVTAGQVARIKAGDNLTTTKPLSVSNSADSASASFGGYGCSFTNGYYLDAAAGTAVVVNEAGADADFRIESDTEPNALFVDGANGNIGIGIGVPLETIHVQKTSTAVYDLSDINNNIGTGDGAMLRLHNTDDTVGSFAGVLFQNRSSLTALGGVVLYSLGANSSDQLYFAEAGSHKWYGGADAATLRMTLDTSGDLTLTGNLALSAKNISTDTTTGTKIGTGPTEKLGKWGATPVVQPSAIPDAVGGATVDTECRAALNALLAALRLTGDIAT